MDKAQSFDVLATHILKWEGGLFVSADEPGGMANKGVTFATYKSLAKRLLGKEPTEVNFRALTDREAKIFIKHYYDEVGADKIQKNSIAAWVTEMAWGSGVKTSVLIVQKTLNTSFNANLVVDGKMGAKTLAAINTTDESRLFDALGVARKQFLIDLTKRVPSKKRYLNGWFRRVDDFIKKKLLLV